MASKSTGERHEVKLPGYGLPFNYLGSDPAHVNEIMDRCAVESWAHYVMTIRERCMLMFMNKITDKPEWYRKVLDEDIVAKWQQEAMSLDWESAGLEYGDMSEQMFAFCIKELRDKASFYEKHSFIPVLDVNTLVAKTDVGITPELKSALKVAVARLENIPDTKKDYHPGTDEKVLDLVHPSLCPLIYGLSRILPDTIIGIENCLPHAGKGEVIPDPMTNNAAFGTTPTPIPFEVWSSHFQWLPSNVTFPDGENAEIQSYINNLHPVDNKDLYGVLEKLITRAMPLWNAILHQFERTGGLRIACTCVESVMPDGFPDERPLEPNEDPDSDDRYERDEEWKSEHRIMVKPEPEEYETSSLLSSENENKDPLSLIESPDKKIQVIVKLANIHLTPEKPEYEGGSWHIEGQLNEHICATALYYYDNENITDSHLSFRTRVDSEMLEENLGYEQNDDEGIERIFGVKNYGSNVQELGSVLTREDRMLAFPNVFQHRVDPFKLVDPTRPGHRKIVALFLVEPTIEIISTANVPPQQRDWWLREVKANGGQIGALPQELVEIIGEGVEDFPIGMEAAKKFREQLMAERSRMDQDVDSKVANNNFSFCEH